MTDFRTWIVGQSAKLGYDFNALTREDQENIISALLSYAEDAFRSQCDYPDMRFGKRRGIYASGDDNSENDKKTNANELFSGDTSTMSTAVGCSSNDANCTFNASCTNGLQSCTNNGCTNEGTGACTNTGGIGYFCTDNGCINKADLGCNDDMGCVDLNTCSNISSGGCTDGASSTGAGVSCTDTGCSNKTSYGASKGCEDTNNCIDEASCLNNSREQNCIDFSTEGSGCSDLECDNRNSYGKTCLDGSEVNNCGDIACINSGNLSTGGCQDDAGCKDSPCANYTKQCTNNSDCVDNACTNQVNCINSATCTERCFDIAGCGNSQVSCRDPGDNCLNESNACIDRGIADTSSCTNFTNCADYTGNTTGCSDNGCGNNSSGETKASNCQDYSGNCVDNECSNIKSGSLASMCVDDVGCSDSPTCTNDRCIDISPTTSCHASDSQCVITDNKCIVVGHREDTYDNQSSCADTDPKGCNANNPYDKFSGCIDRVRATCADTICDPPP